MFPDILLYDYPWFNCKGAFLLWVYNEWYPGRENLSHQLGWEWSKSIRYRPSRCLERAFYKCNDLISPTRLTCAKLRCKKDYVISSESKICGRTQFKSIIVFNDDKPLTDRSKSCGGRDYPWISHDLRFQESRGFLYSNSLCWIWPDSKFIQLIPPSFTAIILYHWKEKKTLTENAGILNFIFSVFWFSVFVKPLIVSVQEKGSSVLKVLWNSPEKLTHGIYYGVEIFYRLNSSLETLRVV